MTRPLNILYVDPSLRNHRGHHANVCISLTSAMRRAGHQTSIAISAKKEPSLDGRAVFSQDVYRQMKRNPNITVDRQRLRSAAANVCARALPIIAQVQPDVIYAHSVNSSIAEGLGHAIDAIYPADLRPTLIAEFPFPCETKPAYFYGPQLADFFMRKNQRVDSSNNPAHWVTVNEDTSALLSKTTGTTIEVMPSPYSTTFHRVPDRDFESPIRIGSLGHQSQAKGFHLLPETIERLGPLNRKIQWVIQHQPDSDPKTLGHLNQLATRFPVELVCSDLDPKQYETLLLSLDAFLLPYQPERYVSAISGICYEGIAQGSCVIAPRETTIGKLVRCFQPGMPQFSVWSAESVADAVGDMVRDFERHWSTAINGSTHYRTTNGPDAYVQKIASLAPSEHPVMQVNRMTLAAGRAYWTARTWMHC